MNDHHRIIVHGRAQIVTTRSFQSPIDEKARSERAEQRLKVVTAFLGFLTAIATALGVTAGLFVKKTSSANRQVDVSQQQVEVLESQNASLRKRMAELEAAASGPTSSSVQTTDSSPTGAIDTPGNIYHEGRFTLLPRKQADLDAPFNDPQWGILAGNEGSNDIEWRPFDDPTIGSKGGSQIKLIGSSAPTLDGCRTVTDYDSTPVSLASVKVGSYFCWITSEKRYAIIQITAMPNGFGKVTINAKVFKKEGD